jgi:hypothetical protein
LKKRERRVERREIERLGEPKGIIEENTGEEMVMIHIQEIRKRMI